MPLPSNDWFKAECVKKIVHGDIFTYKNPVIPIKTKARTYGSLSRQVAAKGIELPDLMLEESKFVDPYIFMAFWDDESEYSAEHLYSCGENIVRVASFYKLPLVAIPLLGGIHAMEHLWVMEKILFDTCDAMDSCGFTYPEHVYVTNKIIA